MPYTRMMDSHLSRDDTNPHKELPWKLWVRRYRTRKQLKKMLNTDPERLLHDLGLHTMAVQHECKKWFWQK